MITMFRGALLTISLLVTIFPINSGILLALLSVLDKIQRQWWWQSKWQWQWLYLHVHVFHFGMREMAVSTYCHPARILPPLRSLPQSSQIQRKNIKQIFKNPKKILPPSEVFCNVHKTKKVLYLIHKNPEKISFPWQFSRNLSKFK